jgi:hypothetical protein
MSKEILLGGETMSKYYCLAIVVLLTFVSMTGCANENKRALFRPENRKKVQSIGLIPPGNPERIIVVDAFAKNIGGAFGLIGEAIGSSIVNSTAEEQSKLFAKSISGTSFNFSGLFTEAMQNNLTKAGYTIKIVSAAKQDQAHFLTSYQGLADNADAYLDVAVVGVGFIADEDVQFIPYISLHVRLVSANNSEIFYRDWLIYGQNSNVVPVRQDLGEGIQIQNADILKPPPEYRFVDFARLYGKSDIAIESLKTGIADITAKVAQKLTAYDSFVYIYRPNAFIKHYVDIAVSVDDCSLGTLKNNGHLTATLPPGVHVVGAKGGGKSPKVMQPLDVKAGQSYYVKVELLDVRDLQTLWQDKLKINMVPEETGKTEMSKTKDLMFD